VKLLAAAKKSGKTIDRSFDKNTSANWSRVFGSITIGCDHWIIDDGVGGYLSQRLDKHGNLYFQGSHHRTRLMTRSKLVPHLVIQSKPTIRFRI